jgi:hypothetical protein
MSTYEDALSLSWSMAESRQIQTFTLPIALNLRRPAHNQNLPDLKFYVFMVNRDHRRFVVLSLPDWSLLIKLAQEMEDIQRALGGGYTRLGQIRQRARHFDVRRQKAVAVQEPDWQELCRQLESVLEADVAQSSGESSVNQPMMICIPPIDSI